MYDNIGGKIKGLAKTMFIVEAIGAIITGVVLMATGEDLTLYGFLTLVCGPIVAYVSSWIWYAFGELVEDIHVMRQGYYSIAEVVRTDYETKEKHKMGTLKKATQCECGELHYAIYCPICGKKAGASTSNTKKPLKVEDKPQSKSTVCKCGERFYGDICPNCGRTIKDL